MTGYKLGACIGRFCVEVGPATVQAGSMKNKTPLRYRISNPVTGAFRTVGARSPEQARSMAPKCWQAEMGESNPVNGAPRVVSVRRVP